MRDRNNAKFKSSIRDSNIREIGKEKERSNDGGKERFSYLRHTSDWRN